MRDHVNWGDVPSNNADPARWQGAVSTPGMAVYVALLVFSPLRVLAQGLDNFLHTTLDLLALRTLLG